VGPVYKKEEISISC